MNTPDELPEDWWTTEHVSAYLSVSPSTLRAYLARGQMPTPDRKMGPLSLWRPDTITEWNSTRTRRTKAP